MSDWESRPSQADRGRRLKATASLKLAEVIARAAEEKKARDIVILDLRKLDAITDFFVICTGDVDQHVRAIGINIESVVSKTTGDRLLHREGKSALNWMLLDYVDVVAHIFKPASREFYRLEDLWGDAEEISLDGVKKPKRAVASKPKPAKRPAGAAKKTPAKPKVRAGERASVKPRPAKSVKPAAPKRPATRKPPVRKSETARPRTRRTKKQ